MAAMIHAAATMLVAHPALLTIRSTLAAATMPAVIAVVVTTLVVIPAAATMAVGLPAVIQVMMVAAALAALQRPIPAFMFRHAAPPHPVPALPLIPVAV